MHLRTADRLSHSFLTNVMYELTIELIFESFWQMGVKIAKARGCVVTVVSRSMGKEKFAKECGATAFVCSTDKAQMAAAAKSFDLVLNTIPSEHKYDDYTKLTAADGKHVILGLNSGVFIIIPFLVSFCSLLLHPPPSHFGRY